MASVNRVILVGHLGRDPETRHLPDGTQIANVSLATSYRYKDRQSGEAKEDTAWHRVVLLGRLAEIAGQYLKKGAQVYVEGRLRYRKWQDKEGQERHTTEIVVSALQMLGARAGNDGGEQEQAPRKQEEPDAKSPPAPKQAAAKADDLEDDIPF